MHLQLQRELSWSKLWIPELRRLIGPHVLRPGNFREDALEGTDLIVLTADRLRIACRVRHPGKSRFWGDQVTFTDLRESGAPCEADKVLRGGWGDLFFYGHATEDDPARGEIDPWFLLDLNLLRPRLPSIRIAGRKRNNDPPGAGCWFIAYRVGEIVDACGLGVVVGCSPGISWRGPQPGGASASHR